jgi:hypothetical protein
LNFFGHAAVAAWSGSATPAFALGAMLPDFVAMSGARSARAAHDDAIRGVWLHHVTDEAFHGAREFVALMGHVRERAEAAGLARGGAWASAHVAVELLLDGALVGDGSAAALYLDALRDAEAHVWCAPEERELLAGFLDRMRGHGVPYGYRDPRFVAARIERALARRPRLALRAGETDALAAVLAEIAGRVRECAPRLLGEVHRRLPAEARWPAERGAGDLREPPRYARFS